MMNSESFAAFGKCIVAGEHAVVRGGLAVALPLRSRSLTLTTRPRADSAFTVEEGPLKEPFLLAWKRARELAGFTAPPAAVSVALKSDIPVRAGLGSSAALAVAVVAFLRAQGAKVQDPFTLALEIENLFHGKSSGLDVAAVLAAAPIAYRRGEVARTLRPAWKPKLYLFDTGERSSTKSCVEKVEAARRPDLDDRMSQASALVASALENPQGKSALAEAMQLAAACFEAWGLGAEPALVKKLEKAGALAVKPTGSGGGGHLLTLWEKDPPRELSLMSVGADSSEAP